VPARLDAIDRNILKELQADGRITNVELARRVGISAPPCLRRVRGLEEAGFIKGYRGVLDEKKLGYEVTIFAMVHLSSQAESDLAAFERFVRAQPLVRECWMLSGEIDFVLKCVAPDLKTFQGFVEKLTSAPNVRNVKTSLVLRQSKDTALVPMECWDARVRHAARTVAPGRGRACLREDEGGARTRHPHGRYFCTAPRRGMSNGPKGSCLASHRATDRKQGRFVRRDCLARCRPKRDGRDKPGHDEERSGKSKGPYRQSTFLIS
jgi:DNA-binding Lrp family transcriptional regulator